MRDPSLLGRKPRFHDSKTTLKAGSTRERRLLDQMNLDSSERRWDTRSSLRWKDGILLRLVIKHGTDSIYETIHLCSFCLLIEMSGPHIVAITAIFLLGLHVDLALIYWTVSVIIKFMIESRTECDMVLELCCSIGLWLGIVPRSVFGFSAWIALS